MNYKSILLLFGCLVADLFTGIFFPGIPPLFLIFAIFFLSQKLNIFEILILAILGGFIFDIAQMSQTIFATLFLSLEALSIQYLTKRYIDFTNKFSQILFLTIIFLTKDFASWLLYDRAWPSHFLVSTLLFSLVSVLIVSIILISKNVKIT